MSAQLAPLWPVAEIADDSCWTHNVPLPCARCAADSQWNRDYRHALRLERQADEIETMTLSDQSDRENLRWFADDLRRQASELRGKCQREADRERR